ncbi:terminase small subunit [Pectinatus frisingensis]|uniref:terminase small subunit n=1 Tax=Pectinatus frisingensis TaxID=865 RepID=UPI0018C5BD59|nr:terminase small subunit [Pectinatus frisingensis]
MSDKKDKQLMQWQYAYADYKAGMKQTDIADKYNVKLPTVKSWYARHWKKMQKEERKNAWKQDAIVDGMHNAEISVDKLNLVDISKPTVRMQFKGIVAKQTNDTKPDAIYNSYTKDNLPQLEPQEARFVEEYLVDLSKTDAAIRAGYSINTAASIGCRLYDKPRIFAHIQVALAERRKRTGVNVDTTIREIARVAFANPANVIDNEGRIKDDAKEDDLRAIAAIKVKTTPTKNGPITEREIRFVDKNKALSMLGEHQGMFIKRKQVDVRQTIEDYTPAEIEQRIKELEKKRVIDADSIIIDDDADKMQTNDDDSSNKR